MLLVELFVKFNLLMDRADAGAISLCSFRGSALDSMVCYDVVTIGLAVSSLCSGSCRFNFPRVPCGKSQHFGSPSFLATQALQNRRYNVFQNLQLHHATGFPPESFKLAADMQRGIFKGGS